MSSNVTARADAKELAAKVSEQTELDAENILDARADDRAGPLVLALDFSRDFSNEELASMPIVGSVEKPDGDKPVSPNNPDITKIEKEMPLGGTRLVNHSWYDDFSANTHLGITLSDHIERLKKAVSAPSNADVETTIINLNEAQDRLRAWADKVRRAISFLQHCEDWRVIENKVGFYLARQPMKDPDTGALLMDEKNQPLMGVSRSPKPIKIWDKSEEGMNKNIQKFVSLSQFLNYDVKSAIANGGGWKELIETAGREMPEASTVEAISLLKLASFYGRINKLFDQENIDKLIAREAAKRETGKAFAWEIMENYLALQRLEPILMPLHDAYEQETKDRQSQARATASPRQITMRTAS